MHLLQASELGGNVLLSLFTTMSSTVGGGSYVTIHSFSVWATTCDSFCASGTSFTLLRRSIVFSHKGLCCMCWLEHLERRRYSLSELATICGCAHLRSRQTGASSRSVHRWNSPPTSPARASCAMRLMTSARSKNARTTWCVCVRVLPRHHLHPVKTTMLLEA